MVVAGAPNVVVHLAVCGLKGLESAVAPGVKISALLNTNKRAVIVWTEASNNERGRVLNVIMVDIVVVVRGAVRDLAVMSAARVEQGEKVGILPLAIDGRAVQNLANFGRVAFSGIVVQTDQSFVVVVLLGVPSKHGMPPPPPPSSPLRTIGLQSDTAVSINELERVDCTPESGPVLGSQLFGGSTQCLVAAK